MPIWHETDGFMKVQNYVWDAGNLQWIAQATGVGQPSGTPAHQGARWHDRDGNIKVRNYIWDAAALEWIAQPA